MEIRDLLARGRVSALACTLLALAACQVLPPEHAVDAAAGRVRAERVETAREVAQLLDRLQPAVVALLPEARARRVEVWVQETPALYTIARRTYQDADGFYSDAEDRIHLRAGADSLERTLAHELVHAHLAGAWSALPGTLEEGLCDHLSAELCPGARARLRAGRLSCAGFALGGLALDLTVRIPAERHPSGLAVSFQARLRLEGEPPISADPLGVFQRQAGLSSSGMSSGQKKAYYGLAYLLVDRIVGRVGIEGLHELCREAREGDDDHVSRAALLEAADLGTDPDSWRGALVEAYEPADLRELVRMHPEFLVRALDDFFAPCLSPEELVEALPGLEARLTLAGGAGLDLFELPEVRERLAGLWSARSTAALARR